MWNSSTNSRYLNHSLFTSFNSLADSFWDFLSLTSAEGSKMEQAAEVGKALAETAAKKNIKSVVFDRSGYLYHGRKLTNNLF